MPDVYGILGVLLSLLTPFTAPGADEPARAGEASRLIRQLGDDSFAGREEASRQLLARGRAVLPALRQGALDRDPEIATRCRRILDELWSAEINALLADRQGDGDYVLIPWANYRDQFGTDEAGRRFFVDLITRHPDFFERLRARPQLASAFFQEHVGKLRASFYPRLGGRDSLAPSEVGCLLAGATDPRLDLGDDTHQKVVDLLAFDTTFPALEGPPGRPVVTRLMLAWVGRWKSLDNVGGLSRLMEGYLRREGIPLARTIALDRRLRPWTRAWALIWIGFYGAAADRAALRPLLSEHTLVSRHGFGGEPQRDVLIRDLALGVTIHLSGRNPADFGPRDVVFGADLGDPKKYLAHPHCLYFGFATAEARAAAFARWRETEKADSRAK